MIVSLYKKTEDTLTRIANTVLDEMRHATFTANEEWEVTHYGIWNDLNSAMVISPLPMTVRVKQGYSLTLDLKNVSFETTNLNTEEDGEDIVLESQWPN